MERERLTQLLQNPDSVVREDLADLRSLVARYPWFSGAQVLQASGEGLAGDIRSEETLNTAAAHVPSRAVLFDLAQSKAGTVRGPHAAPTHPGPLALVPKEAPRPAANDHGTPSESIERTAAVAPAMELTSTVNEDTQAERIALAAEVESEEEPLSADPLERQILEAAMASAYDLTLHHAPFQATKQDEQAEEANSNSVSVEPVAPSTEEITIPKEPPAAAIAPLEVTLENLDQPRSSRKSFSAWLDATPQPASAPSVQTSHELQEVGPKAIVAVVPSAEERKSIVDKFITQEIGTFVPKKEFFTPQQAAKRSLDDTAGLVTETLAGIYAKQGSTAKAMDAYRKLALKYPEKSAYFAGLLQTLEAQQNK